MFKLSQLRGFNAGGSPRFSSLEYIGRASSNSDRTSYSFNDQNIGTPAANRTVIVLAGCSSATLDNVTINGNTMDEIVAVADTTSSDHGIGFFKYDLATGTTADFDVNLTDGAQGCAMGVWAVYGWGGVLIDSEFTKNSTADTTEITIDGVRGGAVLAGLQTLSNDNDTVTWGSNVTERFERETGSDRELSGADTGRLAASERLTIQATRPNTTADKTLLGISL